MVLMVVSARAAARSSRVLRPRSSVLFLAFLLVTLLVAAALAYQAIAAARSHRSTVEAALRDYASTAAWELTRRARAGFSELLSDAFRPIHRRARRGRLPPPEMVVAELDDALRDQGCRCAAMRHPLAAFRFVDGGAPELTVTPDTLSDAARAGLRAMLAAGFRTFRHHPARFVVDSVAGDPNARLVVYTIVDDEADVPRAAYGFVTTIRGLEPLFARWYAAGSLLPPAVSGGRANDSLLSVTVRAPGGVVAFTSPARYPTTFVASDSLEGMLGGLVVEAAVRADAADALIIGGLPRSRLPLIIGLLLLTVGVGTAGLVQLRRERQLARLRDDFVSGVSHELRTPLTHIRMFAELLEDGRLRSDGERVRSVRIISREARRLSQLVENILHFSHARRGSGAVAPERLDAEAVLRDVTEAFEPVAEARDVVLTLDVPSGLTVHADRNALQQMILNLLDNAVKYGPPGQMVRVRGVRAGAAVRIMVEDEGPGVPRRDRRRVFEAYRRLTRDAGGTVRGSGIGLTVVTQLVRAHRGRAWVEDAGGRGARFVLELPSDGAMERPEVHA